MIAERLQGWLDEILESSGQQWRLRLVALLTPIAAVLAATAETGAWWGPGLVLVSLLAAAASIRPDTHLSLVVIALIMWHWLATVDDVDSIWLPVAAVSLVAHHTVVALTATVPTGGELPRPVLRNWSSRLVVCSTLTVLVWAVTVAMERRDAAGNGLLTGLALALLAGAAVLIRARSVDRPQLP